MISKHGLAYALLLNNKHVFFRQSDRSPVHKVEVFLNYVGLKSSFFTFFKRDLSTLKLFCVCGKRHNAFQLPVFFFPSSRFSASLIRNIGEFGAKNYFTDHRTANTNHLFVPIKRKLFGTILFQNRLQLSGIPQRVLDRYTRLFICKIDIE